MEVSCKAVTKAASGAARGLSADQNLLRTTSLDLLRRLRSVLNIQSLLPSGGSLKVKAVDPAHSEPSSKRQKTETKKVHAPISGQTTPSSSQAVTPLGVGSTGDIPVILNP